MRSMMKDPSKTITTYRHTLRENILSTAMHDFIRHGIKAVKMDDIAGQLGISKRTLYELYDNKGVLLLESVKYWKAKKDLEMAALAAQSTNVMETIMTFYYAKVEDLKSTNPLLYAEIVKYPQVVEFFEQEKKRNQEISRRFLQRGLDEGYFRSDIDYELLGMLLDNVPQSVLQQQLYRQYNIDELYSSMVLVLLRGICTPKGIEELDKNKR